MITDNFDFHHSEYMTIRPWIKARLNELDIECEIRNDNDSLFLIMHIDDVAADFMKDDVEDLIRNKNSTEFFEDYMQMNGHIGHVRVSDLLNHKHATTILWAMLDTLAIFEKFNRDWTQKIFKWIDPDVIYLILSVMPKAQADIIDTPPRCIHIMHIQKKDTLIRECYFFYAYISNAQRYMHRILLAPQGANRNAPN